MDEKDLRIEYFKAPGPGGQRKNKVKTACRIVHIPTGTTVTVNTRSQVQSEKQARKNLEKKLQDQKDKINAIAKKARRDEAIKDPRYIRTYDFKRNEVRDHRTGKRADLKKVLKEGMFELLHPDDKDIKKIRDNDGY